MKLYSLFLILLLAYNINGYSDDKTDELLVSFEDTLKRILDEVQLHPDAGLNISQFLEKYDYPLESHQVATEDGFILTLDRVPYGRNEAHKNDLNKPVVLFVHCLACSSVDWVYMGPDSSLALLLADRGYDVWLLSTRGTAPSMNHKTLNSSDAAFYDFSWHEKGVYDLPASVDYITNTTNVKKIGLVGYSEGTTDILVLAAARPEYNDNINLIGLLSPIAYMNHLTSPIVLLMVKNMEALKLFFKVFGINGIQYSKPIADAGIAMCSDESKFQELCAEGVQLLCGYDSPQLNRSFLSLFMTNKPAGLSIKELIHYGQEISSGYFRQYDYGLANIIHYGTIDPPSYDPTKITAPVAAYYGKNDFLAATEDVKRLLDQLPNLVQDHLIEYELFNHLDFLIAMDVKTLLYDQVISDMEKYNPITN